MVQTLTNRQTARKRKGKKMKATQEDKESAIWALTTANEFLRKGGLLVVSIKHTSQSNMSWRFDAHVMYHSEGRGVDYMYLNWAIATLADLRQHPNGEVKYNSLGTERGFEIGYLLRNLFRVYDLPEFQPRHLTIA